MLFHGNSGYAKAPQCYVYTYIVCVFILSIFFKAPYHSLRSYDIVFLFVWFIKIWMINTWKYETLQDRILTDSCCTKKCSFRKVGSQTSASCNQLLKCIIIYLTFKRACAYVTLAVRHVAWYMFKPISFKEFKKSGFTAASRHKLKGNCTVS